MRRSAPFPVLFFASAAHGMNHVLIALYLTLVLVVAQDWHLPYNDLIALWAPGAMLLGLGAPLSGWLGDRFGQTRMLIACFLGLGISSVLAGFAQTPLQLEGALALLGLSGSIYHPVGFPWVVRHAFVRGRAVASTGIAGSFGVALSPVVAGGLATLAGWRIGFIVPGALTIILGLALLAFHLIGPHHRPQGRCGGTRAHQPRRQAARLRRAGRHHDDHAGALFRFRHGVAEADPDRHRGGRLRLLRHRAGHRRDLAAGLGRAIHRRPFRRPWPRQARLSCGLCACSHSFSRW